MSDSSNWTSKVSAKILQFRVWILSFFTLLFVVLGYNASKFKIDASAETLLTKNNKLFIQSQMANQTFSPDEFILIAYQPKSGDVFNQQAIDDIQSLSAEFRKIDRVTALNSMLTVPLIQDKSQLLSANNVANLTYEKQDYSPQDLRALLSDHPIFTDLLVNKNQDATAIQLVFKSNPDEQQKLKKLQTAAAKIENKIGKVRQQELQQIEQIIGNADMDASVYIGGSYVVGIRLIEIVKQDLVYFGIGISALISLLLLLLFRSIKWVVFPVLACASSVVLTLGLLAILKLPATVISANFIALQLILTLAIMLHLITHYREISRQNTQLDQHQRIQRTLSEKLAPCFFAALTTSVGFGSLIFSGIQPVMDFGKMMLLSNVMTLSVALLLFPALLSFLPATTENNEYTRLNQGLQTLANKVQARPKSFVIIPLVIMGLISLGATKLNVENSFIDYFHPDTKVHQELSFIDQEFGGSTPLDILIEYQPEQDDLFLSAQQVGTLQLGHAAVDAFDATGNVTSLINFTTLAKQLNDNAPITEYELDVIYSLVDEKVIDSLIGAYIDTESQTMRISTRVQDTLEGLNRAEFLSNLKKDLIASGLTDDQFQLTNLFVLYQDILSQLFESQITTLGLVYIVIGLVLLAIFRSLKLALIALVPNVITTLTILGIIGWTGIPLDLMTITIAAIAMGIAIDDTIHFVDAYNQPNEDNPIHYAFARTGLAIVYTSTLIALGFSMFVFSDFMPSVYFGILTASAMLLAIVTDLTVLPALLQRFTRPDSK